MGKRIKRERKKGNQEATFFGPYEERQPQGRSILGQVVRFPVSHPLAFEVTLHNAPCSKDGHGRQGYAGGAGGHPRDHAIVTDKQMVHIMRLKIGVDHRGFGVDPCPAGPYQASKFGSSASPTNRMVRS